MVTAGSLVRFENHDDRIHNIQSRSPKNRFSLGAHSPGTTKEIVLKNPGPISLNCNIHFEMRAFIYVSPSDHFAVTNRQGRFQIQGLSKGPYRIEAWHSRLTPDQINEGGPIIDVMNTVQRIDLKFTTLTDEKADLSEVMLRDWIKVVDEIRASLDRAMNLWKKGKQTSATSRVMTTQSRLYSESGLRNAISQSFGKAQAFRYEQEFDTIRKWIQGIGRKSVKEEELRGKINTLIGNLRRDAKTISSR